MPKINIPLSENRSTAMVNNIPYDQGFIQQAQQATEQGFNRLASTAMSEVATYRSMYQRASLQEAQAKNAMFQGAFKMFGDIGEAYNQYQQEIQNVDLKLQQKEAQRESEYYQLVEGTNLALTMESRMSAIRQAADDGGHAAFVNELTYGPATTPSGNASPSDRALSQAGNVEWFNEYSKQILDRAPNPEARLAMSETLMKAGLSLSKEVVKEKIKAESIARVGMAAKSTDAIIGSFSQKPYQDIKPVFDTIDMTASKMLEEGVPAENVEQYRQAKYNQAAQVQSEGLLRNGDIQASVAVITNAFVEGKVSQDVAKLQIDKARQAEFDLELTKNEDLRKTKALMYVSQNLLRQGTPEQEKASYEYYNIWATRVLGDTSQIQEKDMRKTSAQIYSYFTRQNTISKQTTDEFLYKIQFSKNPTEAAAISMAIDSTMNNKASNYMSRQISNNINTANPDLVEASTFISNRIKTGASATEAVNDYRISTDISNRELMNYRKEQLQEVMKDSSYSPTKIVKSTDGWFDGKSLRGADLTLAEVEAASIFKSTFLKTGDKDVAYKVAQTYIDNNYVPSIVNGKSMMVKHAPEMYYNEENINIFYKGVADHLSKAFGENVELVGVPVNIKDKQIVEYDFPVYDPNRTSDSKPTMKKYSEVRSNTIPATSDDGWVVRNKITGETKKVYITPWEGLTNAPELNKDDLHRIYIITGPNGELIESIDKEGRKGVMNFSLERDDAKYQEEINKIYSDVTGKGLAEDVKKSMQIKNMIEQKYPYPPIEIRQDTVETPKVKPSEPGSWKKEVDVPANGVKASIRYNNPGAAYPSKADEKYGIEGYGIIGGGHKIGKFPTPVHGLAANFDLFSRNYTGLTVKEAVRKWRGGNGGLEVPKGIDPNTKITKDQINDKEFMLSLFRGMAKHEAGKDHLSEREIEEAYELFKSKQG